MNTANSHPLSGELNDFRNVFSSTFFLAQRFFIDAVDDGRDIGGIVGYECKVNGGSGAVTDRETLGF